MGEATGARSRRAGSIRREPTTLNLEDSSVYAITRNVPVPTYRRLSSTWKFSEPLRSKNPERHSNKLMEAPRQFKN